jgi:hypothetical protein
LLFLHNPVVEVIEEGERGGQQRRQGPAADALGQYGGVASLGFGAHGGRGEHLVNFLCGVLGSGSDTGLVVEHLVDGFEVGFVLDVLAVLIPLFGQAALTRARAVTRLAERKPNGD